MENLNRSILGTTLFLFFSAAGIADEVLRNRALPRLSGELILDGHLSDPIWKDALRMDDFYEISPGDNTPPVVRTAAYLGYDSRFLYAAVHCFDPHPEQIRAAYSDRDSIFGDQDFVQFDLDTRNDEKSSFIFRVNPRGIQADAIFSESTGLDDSAHVMKTDLRISSLRSRMHLNRNAGGSPASMRTRRIPCQKSREYGLGKFHLQGSKSI